MNVLNEFEQFLESKVTNPIEQTKALIERESYGFVNTSEVLSAFSQAGWNQVSTTVGRVNNPERQGFQKHLIRLENPLFSKIEGLTDNNQSRPQLVLLNSHDGTTSLQILWGLIRIACMNGIIAGTGVNGVRLIHSKAIVDKLPNAIEYMLGNFETFVKQIESLQGKTLSDSASAELVKTLYNARLAGIQRVKSIVYDTPSALRIQDNANDAFTVYNRVQEVLMRGGIQYEYEKSILDANGQEIGTKLVSTRTRRIASVTSQVKLNQLAYDTAIELAA